MSRVALVLFTSLIVLASVAHADEKKDALKKLIADNETALKTIGETTKDGKFKNDAQALQESFAKLLGDAKFAGIMVDKKSGSALIGGKLCIKAGKFIHIIDKQGNVVEFDPTYEDVEGKKSGVFLGSAIHREHGEEIIIAKISYTKEKKMQFAVFAGDKNAEIAGGAGIAGETFFIAGTSTRVVKGDTVKEDFGFNCNLKERTLNPGKTYKADTFSSFVVLPPYVKK